MSGPQTEAGRRFVDGDSPKWATVARAEREAIAVAIEAEARAASQERPQPTYGHFEGEGKDRVFVPSTGIAQERPPIDVALDLLREWIEHHQPEGYEGIQDCADINDRTEAFLSRQ